MKIVALMGLLVLGSSKDSSFAKNIINNRIETITLLKERLLVIESDIVEVQYVLNESSCCKDLDDLNKTLHKDRLHIQNSLDAMIEELK